VERVIEAAREVVDGMKSGIAVTQEWDVFQRLIDALAAIDSPTKPDDEPYTGSDGGTLCA